MTPIGNDGAMMTNGIANDGTDDFLRHLTADASDDDTRKPSESGEDIEEPEAPATEETATEPEETDDTDEHEDAPADESDDEGEVDEEDDKGPARKYVDENDDNLYQRIKVGDEVHEVRTKDLARLFGQEAALTKRSQDVADTRKKLDTESAAVLAKQQALIARATERWKQYEGLDFLALSRDNNISTEELTALRAEAQRAWEDVQFLTGETEQFMAAIQQRQMEDLRETAKAAIKELSDPEKGLPGWNEKLYDDIRAHAIQAGAPADIVNKLVEPWAIRLIHDAMMFKRGQSKVVTTKVSKVSKTPRRVVKTTTNPSATKANAPSNAKRAQERLARTGSMEDAASAFAASLLGPVDE